MKSKLFKAIKVLMIIGIISFVLIEAMIVWAAHSADDEAVEYAIVLGAGLRGEEPSVTLKTRLNQAIEYARAHPNVKLIVTGGQGAGELISEAEAMKRYLVAHGIEPERILKEDQATNTMENIIFSRKIIEEMSEKVGEHVPAGDEQPDIENNGQVMIITSDYHLFRAKFLAQRHGLEPLGQPAETPFFISVYYHIRESLAVVKSFVWDR